MGRYKVVIQNIAKLDVEETYHWYENIKEGLGDKWVKKHIMIRLEGHT